MTETTGPMNPKLFTIFSFIEKLADPALEKIRHQQILPKFLLMMPLDDVSVPEGLLLSPLTLSYTHHLEPQKLISLFL